jgi:GTPase SAR1 family protein
MSKLSLKAKTDELFVWAIDLTKNEPSLQNFHQQLKRSHQQLQQPMRVAIVGLIKAGKSTMMNALLGEDIVPTGNVEATFNVNVFRYGDSPSLQVHFNDNRPPEPKSFAELKALTLRAEVNRDYLNSIKYIEVLYPNEILKTFNLVDTPGLLSYYQEDSKNTVDFLQLHGQELTEVTQAEAQGADAVLYLFSHSLAIEDKETVEMFQGQGVGQATPINAIGVLTKVDIYAADPNVSEPMVAGQKICARLSAHPQARQIFYTINPICGLLALGAQTLTDDDWQILTQLAQIPAERMNSLIGNVTRFCEREYADIPVPPSHRQQLFDRLGQYGVQQAYKLLNSGINTPKQLTQELLNSSGVPQLRDLILSHFGHRALLIKLGTVLRQIDRVYYQEKYNVQGKQQQIIEGIAGEFEKLASQEHGFAELVILRNYYEKQIKFNDLEVQQMLAVTGEFGTSCSARLGLTEPVTIPEMTAIALERIHYWQQKAADYLAIDSNTIAAANVLNRSYEGILDRLRNAQKYLDF